MNNNTNYVPSQSAVLERLDPTTFIITCSKYTICDGYEDKLHLLSPHPRPETFSLFVNTAELFSEWFIDKHCWRLVNPSCCFSHYQILMFICAFMRKTSHHPAVVFPRTRVERKIMASSLIKFDFKKRWEAIVSHIEWKMNGIESVNKLM